MKLDDLRNKIDDIDDKIVSLYLERLSVVSEIAEEKRAIGKNVSDPEREAKVVARLTEKIPDEMKGYVARLYDEIFASTKERQFASAKVGAHRDEKPL